jgi:hypothetical protein
MLKVKMEALVREISKLDKAPAIAENKFKRETAKLLNTTHKVNPSVKRSKSQDEQQQEHSLQGYPEVLPRECFSCQSHFGTCEDRNLWRSCDDCSNWCCQVCAMSNLSEENVCNECREC